MMALAHFPMQRQPPQITSIFLPRFHRLSRLMTPLTLEISRAQTTASMMANSLRLLGAGLWQAVQNQKGTSSATLERARMGCIQYRWMI